MKTTNIAHHWQAIDNKGKTQQPSGGAIGLRRLLLYSMQFRLGFLVGRIQPQHLLEVFNCLCNPLHCCPATVQAESLRHACTKAVQFFWSRESRISLQLMPSHIQIHSWHAPVHVSSCKLCCCCLLQQSQVRLKTWNSRNDESMTIQRGRPAVPVAHLSRLCNAVSRLQAATAYSHVVN